MHLITPCCKQELCLECANSAFNLGYQYVNAWGIASERVHACPFCKKNVEAKEFETMMFEAQRKDWEKYPTGDDLGIEQLSVAEYLDQMAANFGTPFKLNNIINMLLAEFRPTLVAGMLKHRLARERISINDIKDFRGVTVLFDAVTYYRTSRHLNTNTKVIDFWLKAAGEGLINLIAQRSNSGETALSWAAANDELVVVELLLNAAGNRAGWLILNDDDLNKYYDCFSPEMKEILSRYSNGN